MADSGRWPRFNVGLRPKLKSEIGGLGFSLAQQVEVLAWLGVRGPRAGPAAQI